MPAPPPLDIAAVIAYCEQRVPPHALYQVRMEAAVDRHAVTLVERRAPWRPEFGPEWTRSPVQHTRLQAGAPWTTMSTPCASGQAGASGCALRGWERPAGLGEQLSSVRAGSVTLSAQRPATSCPSISVCAHPM
jgi:hypothetical protein